jgi:hypothetical protein
MSSFIPLGDFLSSRTRYARGRGKSTEKLGEERRKEVRRADDTFH